MHTHITSKRFGRRLKCAYWWHSIQCSQEHRAKMRWNTSLYRSNCSSLYLAHSQPTSNIVTMQTGRHRQRTNERDHVCSLLIVNCCELKWKSGLFYSPRAVLTSPGKRWDSQLHARGWQGEHQVAPLLFKQFLILSGIRGRQKRESWYTHPWILSAHRNKFSGQSEDRSGHRNVTNRQSDCSSWIAIVRHRSKSTCIEPSFRNENFWSSEVLKRSIVLRHGSESEWIVYL